MPGGHILYQRDRQAAAPPGQLDYNLALLGASSLTERGSSTQHPIVKNRESLSFEMPALRLIPGYVGTS